MSWRCAIGVDVGGTFTDLVLVTTDGRRHVTKVPSVPSDPARGVFHALDAVADSLTMDRRHLIGRADRIVHGSTVATNAVITRNLARVGLLTTAGFRDSLEIRRGIRDDQWDHRAPWPPVVVPRHLRRGVRGRIGADGTELEALDTDDVHRAVDHFRDEGVAAVAICFLHSYLSAEHEAAAAAITRKVWPGPLTTVSSELTPLLGEYERTSTAVVNAGLVPQVSGYVQRLAEGLRELGFDGSLLLLQSNGGMAPAHTVGARPVDLVLSGPAAVGGATRLLDGGSGPLVSMEIGGTSCDVAVSAGGVVPVIDGLQVGGYHLNVPAVDVHSVGAGGGTIAWVDSAGLLHVGPEGAGADPGPAAYGRGGTDPTVTDAHLVLGRLRPGPLAGGTVHLDPELAAAAIDARVARPLGLSTVEAARGIIALVEQHLRHAVEGITLQRGRDPAAMTLVAAGGAGGLHGAGIARGLGCARLIVPAEAGVFCAVGMLNSDLRTDLSRTIVGPLDEIGAPAVLDALASVGEDAIQRCRRDWPSGIAIDTRGYADLRYPGQLWSVRVPVGPASTDADIREAFEAEYERLFGHIQPGGRLLVTGITLAARGVLDDLPPIRVDGVSEGSPAATRRCWVDDTLGWCDVPIHDAAALGPGDRLHGPLIVEADTTTVLVGPDDALGVGPAGDLEVTLR